MTAATTAPERTAPLVLLEGGALQLLVLHRFVTVLPACRVEMETAHFATALPDCEDVIIP